MEHLKLDLKQKSNLEHVVLAAAYTALALHCVIVLFYGLLSFYCFHCFLLHYKVNKLVVVVVSNYSKRFYIN